jgi:predicted nucleic acid-binding protein
VVSSESPDSVIDTVVLMYFLMVDEVELLLDLLGDPIAVPRVVFDPDEPPPAEVEDADTLCEISRSIEHHRRVSQDPARNGDARQTAARNADRLATMAGLHERGHVVVLDLTAGELELLGRLTSRETCGEFGLRFPLDAGEAACLALAVSQELTLATDDTDALTAVKSHAPGHPYERIRRLLIAAGERGVRTKLEANEIHERMRRLGFWDATMPFPDP